MKMLIIVLILVVAVIAIGLSRHGTIISSSGEVISVPDDDPEMAAAIQKAKDTLPIFVTALQAPATGECHLLVKARFVEGMASEHMWVADLTVASNAFHGVIADEPESIKGLRFKQPVTVTFDQISDWMIVQDGKVKGAFSTRVLRKKMDVEQRKAFDKRLPFTFDEAEESSTPSQGMPRPARQP